LTAQVLIINLEHKRK